MFWLMPHATQISAQASLAALVPIVGPYFIAYFDNFLFFPYSQGSLKQLKLELRTVSIKHHGPIG
jgi:hypothetical protein